MRKYYGRVKPGQRVVVPKTAVISEAGKHYVWIVKDGMVSRKEVALGGIEVINVIIKAGLEAGARHRYL